MVASSHFQANFIRTVPLHQNWDILDLQMDTLLDGDQMTCHLRRWDS